MPKIDLTLENKKQQNTDYNRLSLEHGERALINCIELSPTEAYRHVLKAPEIGPDGRVIMETRKNSKQEEYEAPRQEFFGQHLCFGDYETLSTKGIDPDNCPTCRAAEEEEGIGAPSPHYAMHVIKYALQPGGFQLRDPFSVECLAWVFSPTRLNTLIDIATDLEDGDDLRKHDLRLGPCENAKFQKYDIHVSTSVAAWLKDEDRKNFVAQTFANNKCDDLENLIARRVTKSQALEDIRKVVDRVAQVHRIKNGSPATSVPDLSALQPKDAGSTPPWENETPGEKAAGEAFKVDTATGEVTESKGELKQMDLSSILNEL